MSEVINRKEKLSKEFNAAILNILEDMGDNMDNDFYKHLTFKTLVNLKKVLSNINNLITLQTSVAFVYFLCKRNKIRPKVASNVIKEINKTNANANGYDIVCTNGSFPFVAEVKCNIPCGKKGQKYGAAQIASIKTDLEGLRNGKKKTLGLNLKNYYRFMVVLECDGIGKAIEGLECEDVKIWNDKLEFNKDIIYIIPINLENNEVDKEFDK